MANEYGLDFGDTNWTYEPDGSTGWSIDPGVSWTDIGYSYDPNWMSGAADTPVEYYDWQGNPITAAQYTAAVQAAGEQVNPAQSSSNPTGAVPTSQGMLSSAIDYARQTGQDVNNVLKAWGVTGGMGGLITGGAKLAGGLLSGSQAQGALNQQAQTQADIARMQAEMSRFRPVGVTTRFGQSNYTYDPQGNVVGAGYNLSPELLQQQNALMGLSNQALTQAGQTFANTAPMGTAAQRMMTLGNQYLTASPQEQAAKYMAEQQALLAPARQRAEAEALAREQAAGTYGLSVGSTSSGMMGANPRLEALYNAQRQQDLGLASQATLGGQQYATFGSGMVGAGGDMLKGMFGTQVAGYAPYNAALGGAQTLEGLGQQPLDIGVNIGAKGQAAGAQSASMLGAGLNAAAATQAASNAYSPWGTALSGIGTQLGNMQAQQAQTEQTNAFLNAMRR